MSANLINLYGQQFATQVQLLLQQKQSMFRGAVTEGAYRGEQASPVDQVGAVEMQPVINKFGPITRTDAAVDRRWVLPTPYDLAQQVDSFDKLKILSDPMNQYAQNAVNAVNRKIDAVVVSAYYGTASTGKTGSTGTAFTSGNEVSASYASSGTIGMTVAKLRQVKKLARDNKVGEDEEWYCALSPLAHDNLLAETQVISTDFNDRPVLVDGIVKRFLGINFMIYTGLPTSSSNRRVPIWVKSGLHLGMWEDNQFDVSQRKDLIGLPWQIYNKMMLGSTRLEENKCYSILCGE